MLFNNLSRRQLIQLRSFPFGKTINIVIHVELQLVIRHPLQLHFRSQWQTHVIHCKQRFQQNHIVPLADYFFL